MIGHLVAELAEVDAKMWREEDRSRANDYRDAADAKRNLDKLNLRRHELIREIDEAVLRMVK